MYVPLMWDLRPAPCLDPSRVSGLDGDGPKGQGDGSIRAAGRRRPMALFPSSDSREPPGTDSCGFGTTHPLLDRSNRRRGCCVVEPWELALGSTRLAVIRDPTSRPSIAILRKDSLEIRFEATINSGHHRRHGGHGGLSGTALAAGPVFNNGSFETGNYVRFVPASTSRDSRPGRRTSPDGRSPVAASTGSGRTGRPQTAPGALTSMAPRQPLPAASARPSTRASAAPTSSRSTCRATRTPGRPSSR